MNSESVIGELTFWNIKSTLSVMNSNEKSVKTIISTKVTKQIHKTLTIWHIT